MCRVNCVTATYFASLSRRHYFAGLTCTATRTPWFATVHRIFVKKILLTDILSSLIRVNDYQQTTLINKQLKQKMNQLMLETVACKRLEFSNP